MRYKAFRIIICIIVSTMCYSQNTYEGIIFSQEEKATLSNVNIYDFYEGYITKSDEQGKFSISDTRDSIKLVFHKENFSHKTITINHFKPNNIFLEKIYIELNEIQIREEKFDFDSDNLSDIVENAIYAAKKSDKIIVDEKLASTATNNARQIYNKIGGLNIFQNDDAGIQLNIGGRGLNPSRSANFNIRQNGYDISADVLGYPESYYTPPAEALKEIQITRGAASLQYGTQFGGLINFKFKEPEKNNYFNINFQNTFGSNNLYTNFTSLEGRENKFGYYLFLNYKKGDGFRPNSNFESVNLFTHIQYQLSESIKISAEITYLDYLAKQGGGLTDQMFFENPLQSNRTRNWFKVNWLLLNTKVLYKINSNNKLSLNLFYLDASRYALGFRDNRVDQIDPLGVRDLILGQFNNYGVEKRFLKKYNLYDKKTVFLLGAKIYKSNNSSQQGPGSIQSDADFNFYNQQFPYYNNQSNYNYPNLNLALFAENIFYIDSNFLITPGCRFEHINTKSNGQYRNIRFNLAQQPIFDSTYYEKRKNVRNFVLFGIGISYKFNSLETYSNISQNYRSVTFSDMSINNPSFRIDPNIKDESGYTFDIGLRSKKNKLIRYDINYFNLLYNDRIGFISKKIEENPGYTTVKTERGNVGNARINGIESLFDLNIGNLLNSSYKLNTYINFAYSNSLYIYSESNGIAGNEVEFTPRLNIKSGLIFGNKTHMGNIQFSYLSSQYTDASNAVESDITGIIGRIPSYHIIDISYKAQFKICTLNFGINNITNNSYFTRRASGYPGPGIIPSPPRNYFVTCQIKL